MNKFVKGALATGVICVALVGTSAFASDTNQATLKRGDEGQAVRELQQALSNQGFLKASITGFYGGQTEQAVKDFQSAKGLSITGKADAQTLKALYGEDYAPSDTEDKNDTSNPSGEVTKTLYRVGDSGSEVTKIQERLIELNYLEGPSTGYFGGLTQTAVRNFQSANGLSADGIVGSQTKTLLYSSSAKPSGSTSNGNNSDTTPTTPESQPSTPESGATSTLSRNLKVGCSGSDVTTLQAKLKELKYFSGACTGYFGSATQSAVKAFQSANGLSADGIVGQKTWAVLMNGATTNPGEDTTPEPPSTPDENTPPTPDESTPPTTDEGAAPTLSRNLKVGCSGNDVTTLQTKLKELKYFSGTCTGYFGSVTQSAVKTFQSANNLAADGVVGQKTWTALMGASTPVQPDDGNDGAQPDDPNADTGVPVFTKNLKLGSSGTEVTQLQGRLKDLKYFTVSVDGYFGSMTNAAVRGFQNNNNLTVDGIVGPATHAVLYSEQAKDAESGNGGTDGDSNASSPTISNFLANAQSHLGKPYVWGGNGPNSFDCSGFVYYTLNQSGYKVNRLSAAGYYATDKWQFISSVSALQPGDLVFWTDDGSSRIGHTGIYLGNNQFIHASTSSGGIIISSFNGQYSWYDRNFAGGRRIF